MVNVDQQRFNEKSVSELQCEIFTMAVGGVCPDEKQSYCYMLNNLRSRLSNDNMGHFLDQIKTMKDTKDSLDTYRLLSEFTLEALKLNLYKVHYMHSQEKSKKADVAGKNLIAQLEEAIKFVDQDIKGGE